jgi:hypothetical protein
MTEILQVVGVWLTTTTAGAPGWCWVAGVLVVAVLIRRVRRSGADMDTLAGLLAATLATSMSAQGMWRFFGDRLGLDGPGRILLFAFLELTMGISAYRSRRLILDQIAELETLGTETVRVAHIHQSIVWLVAGLSGVLAASDATTGPARLLRLAAPLLAAALWEVGQHTALAAARARAGVTLRRRYRWRLTPTVVLARLGLVQPADLEATEVPALEARLLRWSYRLHATGWLAAVIRPLARVQQRRLAMQLAARAEWLPELQGRLRLVYGLEAATAPAVVQSASVQSVAVAVVQLPPVQPPPPAVQPAPVQSDRAELVQSPAPAAAVQSAPADAETVQIPAVDKGALALGALRETGGSVREAVALLADRGTPVGQRTVAYAKSRSREWATEVVLDPAPASLRLAR